MSTWLLSYGSKKFQLEKCLEKYGYVDWTQTRKVEVGDIVFVYISKPVGAVKYLMRVDSTNMIFEKTTDNEEFWFDKTVYDRGKKRDCYFRLVLKKELPNDDRLSYKGLSYNGLGGVQGMQKLEGVKKEYFKDFI